MSVTKEPSGYGAPAIVFHWLIAALIFGGFSLGLYMDELRMSPLKLKVVSWHKWIGITVLLLAFLRALWRATHAAPPLVPGLPLWQQRLAHGTHWGLYALMFLVPLSGWAFSSASGFQVVYFGLIPLPNLLPKSKPLAELFETIHVSLNWTLATLVALHAAGALKHHFIDRDGTLARMLPWLRGRIKA